MLEVGWHRSAQLDGDEWWCAAGFSAARRPAPHLQMLPHCSPSWIISGLAVLWSSIDLLPIRGEGGPRQGGGDVQYCTYMVMRSP